MRSIVGRQVEGVERSLNECADAPFGKPRTGLHGISWSAAVRGYRAPEPSASPRHPAVGMTILACFREVARCISSPVTSIRGSDDITARPRGTEALPTSSAHGALFSSSLVRRARTAPELLAIFRYSPFGFVSSTTNALAPIMHPSAIVTPGLIVTSAMTQAPALTVIGATVTCGEDRRLGSPL
jgi:hypothetical protein